MAMALSDPQYTHEIRSEPRRSRSLVLISHNFFFFFSLFVMLLVTTAIETERSHINQTSNARHLPEAAHKKPI